MEAKSEYPVVSLDYAFTRSLTEPTEADKEDLKLYGGDIRGGIALVVTKNSCRSILALPVLGKGRAQAKYLVEQIIRYINVCGFSTCIVKADAEPATSLLLDIVAKERQKLGFKTIVELTGQGNGRVEGKLRLCEDWSKPSFELCVKEPKLKLIFMDFLRNMHSVTQPGF